MSEERLKFLGRRSELDLRKRNLSLRIEALVNGMRDELDPMKPISDLRTDLIVSQALELAETRDRYQETLADLRKILDILGR
jgi:hypothetical protein